MTELSIIYWIGVVVVWIMAVKKLNVGQRTYYTRDRISRFIDDMMFTFGASVLALFWPIVLVVLVAVYPLVWLARLVA